jgi:hypothetical protein
MEAPAHDGNGERLSEVDYKDLVVKLEHMYQKEHGSLHTHTAGYDEDGGPQECGLRASRGSGGNGGLGFVREHRALRGGKTMPTRATIQRGRGGRYLVGRTCWL